MPAPAGWLRGPPRDSLVAGALLLFGLCLTLPYSGPKVHWTDPDGLFLEAQKREIQGEPRYEALRQVFGSDLATAAKQYESNLPPRLKRVDNPRWVRYSSRFYRRRWTVPIMAAALDPLFGTRALEEVSLLGWAFLPPVLYLLLRRRFSAGPAVFASVFCTLLPPLIVLAAGPGVDTWGLTLLVAGLLLALMVRERGLRWLPVWIAAVFVLSFTRDETIVLVIATGWLAWRERSRVMTAVTATGALASLPAPLLFSAPLRDNLAYVENSYRIPADTSWGSILPRYPHELGYTVGNDLLYPIHPALPVLSFLMLVPVVAAVVAMCMRMKERDSFVTLIRATAVGGVLTILVSANYTALRLEFVFVPALATGLALVCEWLLRDSPWSRGRYGSRFSMLRRPEVGTLNSQ